MLDLDKLYKIHGLNRDKDKKELEPQEKVSPLDLNKLYEIHGLNRDEDKKELEPQEKVSSKQTLEQDMLNLSDNEFDRISKRRKAQKQKSQKLEQYMLNLSDDELSRILKQREEQKAKQTLPQEQNDTTTQEQNIYTQKAQELVKNKLDQTNKITPQERYIPNQLHEDESLQNIYLAHKLNGTADLYFSKEEQELLEPAVPQVAENQTQDDDKETELSMSDEEWEKALKELEEEREYNKKDPLVLGENGFLRQSEQEQIDAQNAYESYVEDQNAHKKFLSSLDKGIENAFTNLGKAWRDDDVYDKRYKKYNFNKTTYTKEEYEKLYKDSLDNEKLFNTTKEQTDDFFKENKTLNKQAFIEKFNSHQRNSHFSDTNYTPQEYLKDIHQNYQDKILTKARTYKAELKSLNSYYTDLLNHFTNSDELNAKHIQEITQDIDDKLKEIFNDKFGLKLQKNKSGQYRAIDKELNIAIYLDDLNSTLSDISASSFELGGAVTGAIAGMRMAPKNPLGQFGGMVIGGAFGSGAGAAMDTMVSLFNTRQKLDAVLMAKKANDAMLGSMAFDFATAGIVKGGSVIAKKSVTKIVPNLPTAKLVKKAYEMAKTQALPLAEKFFDNKNIDEYFKQIEELHKKYKTNIIDNPNVKPSENTIKETFNKVLEDDKKTQAQRELLVKSFATSDGFEILLKAVAENPKNQKDLIREVNKMNSIIAKQLENSDLGLETMIEMSASYQKKVIDNYDKFINKAIAISNELNLSTKTNEIYKKLSELIDTQNVLSTTLNSDKNQLENFLKATFFDKQGNSLKTHLSLQDLNEIRKSTHYLYKNMDTYSGGKMAILYKDIIDAEMENILKQVDKVVKNQGVNSYEIFSNLRKDYSWMKENWNNAFFKPLELNFLQKNGFNKNQILKEHLKAIKNNIQTADKDYLQNSLNKFTSLFSDYDKAIYEMSFIKEIVNLAKIDMEKSGFNAILYDKNAILSKLGDVTFQSKEANAMINLIKDMKKLFDGDVLLAKQLSNVKEPTLRSGIGHTVEGRVKTMRANFFITMLKKYLPVSQTPALQYHLQRALDKSIGTAELKNLIMHDIDNLSKTPLISEKILKEFYIDLARYENAELSYIKELEKDLSKDFISFEPKLNQLDPNLVQLVKDEMFYISKAQKSDPILNGIIFTQKAFKSFVSSILKANERIGNMVNLGMVTGSSVSAIYVKNNQVDIYTHDKNNKKRKIMKNQNIDDITYAKIRYALADLSSDDLDDFSMGLGAISDKDYQDLNKTIKFKIDGIQKLRLKNKIKVSKVGDVEIYIQENKNNTFNIYAKIGNKEKKVFENIHKVDISAETIIDTLK